MAEKVKYKMEKKRKASLTFGAVALALMIALAVGLFMQRSGLTPAYLVFAVGSTPDSYGNKIVWVVVLQNLTGTFEIVTVIDTSNYTSGMIVEIDANYPTYLRTFVQINKSLCGDYIDLADDYTRVYFNISTVCTNELGVKTGSIQSSGDFYQVYYNCEVEWTPTTDTAYECTVEYEAYY